MKKIKLGPFRYVLARKYATEMRDDAEIFIRDGSSVDDIDAWDAALNLAADTYSFISLYLEDLQRNGDRSNSKNFDVKFNTPSNHVSNNRNSDIIPHVGEDVRKNQMALTGMARTMMTNIITNENENSVLKKLELFKGYGAKYVDFATGFLFFDGWKHAEKTIPEDITRFRLLFGFTDPEMAALLSKTLSDEEVKYVLSRLSRKLDASTLEELEKDEKFKGLIENEILKIRWINMLHAKLYLYYKNEMPVTQDERMLFDGRAIVGSSNLTTRGLTQEGEINMWIDNPGDVISLLNWFENMWGKGYELNPQIILDAIVNENARRRVIERGEFIDPEDLGWALIDAYLFLFWHLLGGVYDIEEIKKLAKTKEGIPSLRKHNEEVVINGYHIIDKYGGVILGDPVGTGKSFQALGIIAYLLLKKNIKNILLVAPPHLIKRSDDALSHWERYIKDFFGDFETEGKLPYISESRILKCKYGGREFRITLVSSYGLSLITDNESAINELGTYDVLVIDEAHHFKNIDAKKRKVVDEIVRIHRENNGDNPYTILLTATPIINDIAEILVLMSIYTQGDTGDFDVLARMELEKDVIRRFERYHEIVNKLKNEELEKEERDKLEKERREVLANIRNFLKEAIILRSRAYIERKYGTGKAPRPKLRNMRYEYEKGEDVLVSLIESLNLSYLDLAPSTLLFLKRVSVKSGKKKLTVESEMITLQGIMKIVLAKRLESSPSAFLKTIDRMNSTMEYTLKLLESSMPPLEMAKLLYARKIGQISGDDIKEEDRLAALGIYEKDVSAKESIDQIAARIEKLSKEPNKIEEIKNGIREDIRIIGSIMVGNLDALASQYSSKDEMLLHYLREMEKERKKVIIYSMYVDTVEWLEKYLKEKGIDESKIFVVTGKTKGKGGVIVNFEEEPGFAVMLSTDALSEGVNLEFVDELVNYDIPWTPSTIMQRVGRLWRSGRTKEILFYTILPPEELVDAFSTVIEKVEEKLAKIRDVLVQEIKLLKEEETLTENFEERVYGNVYMKEEIDLRTFMRELGEEEPQGLINKIIDLITSETLEGRSLKDIIKERDEEFKKVEKEIKKGKILNMSTEKIPIALISFGKRYWLRIRGDMKIMEDDAIWDIIKSKWDSIKEGKNYSITWNVRRREIKSEEIIAAFKNRFLPYISSIIRDRKSADWEILNPLLTMDVYMDEELNKLKMGAFLLLAYYFYGKRRSKSRTKAIQKLKELGFIDQDRNPVPTRYANKKTLKELLDALKGDVEEASVEMLI